MTLLFLLLLLVTPYLVITLVGSLIPKFRIASRTRARVGVSLFFIFTSIGHFIRTEEMSAMLPPSVPGRIEVIYITGVLEFLGAVGIWVPRFMRRTGFLLILMLIGLLPANIYSAVNRVDFGGHGAGPIYLLLRLPFQLFVIWWIYFSTEQNWFRRQQQHKSR